VADDDILVFSVGLDVVVHCVSAQIKHSTPRAANIFVDIERVVVQRVCARVPQSDGCTLSLGPLHAAFAAS
jgi:hypothetical protein